MRRLWLSLIGISALVALGACSTAATLTGPDGAAASKSALAGGVDGGSNNRPSIPTLQGGVDGGSNNRH